MSKPETERDRLLRDALKARGGAEYTKRDWFREVFMYHYFRYIVIGAVVLIVLAFIIYDAATRVAADFTLTVGAEYYPDDAMLAELKALIEDEVGDLNGDGKVLANIRVMAVADIDNVDETTLQLMQAFSVTFIAEPENVLYLMHESVLERFLYDDSLSLLSDYGVASDDDYALYAGEVPLVERSGFYGDYWFCLRVRQSDSYDDETTSRNYDAAARVLNRIIGTP